MKKKEVKEVKKPEPVVEVPKVEEAPDLIARREARLKHGR